VPVHFGAVGAEDECGRRSRDFEPAEDGRATRGPVFGTDEDKILVQEILEFGIGVDLLTQQDAAPSASRIEINENEFAFGIGLGDGLIDGAGEPLLSESGGRNKSDNKGRNENSFRCEFHAFLSSRKRV
jgi:hypothetical protein